MGCVVIAMKRIADVKVDDRRKALSGPGLAQYLHWRGACMLCVLCVWLMAVSLSMANALRTYRYTVKSMAGPLQAQMRIIIWINVGILLAHNVASCIGWHKYLRAYIIRRTDFGKSVKMARSAYILDFSTLLILYLIAPMAFFFRVDLLQRDVCVYVIYSTVKMGPLVRQAMATAAMTCGYPDLAALYVKNPPDNPRDLSDWEGHAWCSRKPDFLNLIFGPHPATSTLGPIQTPVNGVIPTAIFQLEGITGARCDVPNLRPTPPTFLEAGATSRGGLGEAFSKFASFLWSSIGKEPLAQLSSRWVPGMLADLSSESILAASVAHLSVSSSIANGFRTTTDCTGDSNSSQCFNVLHAALTADTEQMLPPGDLLTAQSVVCSFAEAMDVAADMSRMSIRMSVQAVGIWCFFQAFMKVFPPCFSVIKGLMRACVNVKTVMPVSTLPGHMLLMGVTAFIPPLQLAMSSLTQIMGSFLFAMGILSLMIYTAWDFKIGGMMTEDRQYDELNTLFKKLNKQKNLWRIAGVVFLILWIFAQVFYANQTSALIEALSLKVLAFNFTSISMFLCNYFYNKALSTMVYTDYLLQAIFAATDDGFRQEVSSRKMEKAMQLREWYILNEEWSKLGALDSPEYDCPKPPPPPVPKGKGKGKGKKGKGWSKGKAKGKGPPLPPKGKGVPKGGKADGKGKGMGLNKGKGKAKGKGKDPDPAAEA